ncbi:hypothetical protein ACIQRC_33115 [Streptomyces californicus]|uniref:hypothetical protein n=1 Tax=Streptomyces californicus TaxID=67351 RepID=UPI003829336B
MTGLYLPTSALDTRAEHLVIRRFKELAAGKAAVFVTPNLDNARIADRIIVLDRGRIVETGTFQSLLDTAVLFADAVQTRARPVRTTVQRATETPPAHRAEGRARVAAGAEPQPASLSARNRCGQLVVDAARPPGWPGIQHPP